MNKNNAFETWKRQLNLVINDKMGLFLDELPSFDLEDPFTTGLTPDEYFTNIMAPQLAMLGYAVGCLDILDSESATFVHEVSNRQAGLTGEELSDLLAATDDAIEALFATAATA